MPHGTCDFRDRPGPSRFTFQDRITHAPVVFSCGNGPVSDAWWECRESNPSAEATSLQPAERPSFTTPVELHVGIEPTTLSQPLCRRSPYPVRQCSM